jgi:hypothetical protein
MTILFAGLVSQSGKLLLALSSTVILAFKSHVTHDHIFLDISAALLLFQLSGVMLQYYLEDSHALKCSACYLLHTGFLFS